MDTVSIAFGSIVLMSIIFYFVIKSAVKNGINQSMLFTDKQRKQYEDEEMKSFEQQIAQAEAREARKKKSKWDKLLDVLFRP